MNEIVTTDTIIETLQGWVETRTPISAAMWLDAAAKLNLLVLDESDKLAELEFAVANRKVKELQGMDKKSVAMADALVEATEEYRSMRKLQAKIKHIDEYIKIAKKQATLKENEMYNQT